MNQIIKNCILALQFCSILIFCSSDPLERMRVYPKIYNTHDVEKIVSLYAEDAVFEVSGFFSLQGIEQIRDIARYDSVLNVQMIIGDLRRHGDTVFCSLTETNDWLTVSEIDTAFYLAAFVFERGLIKSIRAQTESKTEEAFSQVLTALMAWASKEKPGDISEMMLDGVFKYNAINAQKTLQLLKAWKSAQSSSEAKNPDMKGTENLSYNIHLEVE